MRCLISAPSFDHRSEVARQRYQPTWRQMLDMLDEGQKLNFVTNLLQELRREGIIRADGSKRRAIW
jgi:hypothetical protein